MLRLSHLVVAVLIAGGVSESTASEEQSIKFDDLKRNAEHAAQVADEHAEETAYVRSQLIMLKSRGHASAAEIINANLGFQIAEARRNAIEHWREFVLAANGTFHFSTVAAVNRSKYLFLPVGDVSETDVLEPSTAKRIRELRDAELATIPIDLMTRELERIQKEAAANGIVTHSLSGTEPEHANSQLGAITTIHKRLMTLHDEANFDERSALATGATGEQPATELASFEVSLANAKESLNDPQAAWKHAAIVATARAVIASEFAHALADAHRVSALSRYEALRRVPTFALRPRELADTKQLADRLETLQRTARERLAVATKCLMYVISIETLADVEGWTTTFEATTYSNEKLNTNHLNDSLISELVVITSPLPQRLVRRRSTTSNELFPQRGLANIHTTRDAVAFTEREPQPRRNRSRFTNPGATYSSGYAFGQLRRDLPASQRLPRAESLGGPWYLPGSPTNEIRLRRRSWPEP